MMLSPCKNCEDRSVFCHTSCDKYKAYREAKDRENSVFWAKRKTEADFINAKFEKKLKYQRRSKR